MIALNSPPGHSPYHGGPDPIHRALIVEDDPNSALAIVDVLVDEGCECVVAEDGCAALKHLDEHDFPVVISDWNMPRMDGFELCRAIRNKPSPDYTYFIMVTCRDAHEDVVRGLEAGADDYIAKPWSSQELRMRVAAGLRIVGHQPYDMTVASLVKVTELCSSSRPDT